MKLIFIYILTFGTINCFGQSSLNDTTRLVNDFNNDGIGDSLTFYSYRNSVASVKIYNSISKQSFIIGGRGSYNWSKANFLEIIPVPEELVLPVNKMLLDTIIHYLLPGFVGTDPSLEWLIKGYKSQIIDTTDQLFSMTLEGNLDFKYDTFKYPESSFKMISKDTLPVFWNKVCSADYKDYKHGILVYYGHNHRSRDYKHQIDTVTTNYEIYSTAHGIYARKDHKYSWLFITNGTLTGGPEKLRWKSIVSTHLYDKLLIIHQLSGIGDYNNIFIVNIENGKVGLLRIDDDDFCFNSPKCFNFEVVDSKLIVNSSRTKNCVYDIGNIETLSFYMDKIRKRLE